MKLLLTSAGLRNRRVSDFFVSILPKTPQNCAVLMVAYAQNDDERFYIEESKKELIGLGIHDISLFNLRESDFDLRGHFDVIYVCGGNTFSILQRIRILGIDKLIVNAVKNDNAIYLGVSAGSIMAGPDIAIAGFGSEGDVNEVGLSDLTGFGLADIYVFPHFKDQLKKEADDFKNNTNYPVVALTDDEAVFVDDAQFQIIR